MAAIPQTFEIIMMHQLRDADRDELNLEYVVSWPTCQWSSSDGTDKELLDMYQRHGVPGVVSLKTVGPIPTKAITDAQTIAEELANEDESDEDIVITQAVINAAEDASNRGWHVVGGQVLLAVNPADSSEVWTFYHAEKIWKRKGYQSRKHLRRIVAAQG